MDDLDAGIVPTITLTPESEYDFLYVGDASESVCRALTTPNTDRPVNIVSGRSTTLEQMVTTLIEVAGADVTPNWKPDASLLPASRHFDPSRVEEMLGFVPATTVAEGLAAFVDWRRKRGGR